MDDEDVDDLGGGLGEAMTDSAAAVGEGVRSHYPRPHFSFASLYCRVQFLGPPLTRFFMAQ